MLDSQESSAETPLQLAAAAGIILLKILVCNQKLTDKTAALPNQTFLIRNTFLIRRNYNGVNKNWLQYNIYFEVFVWLTVLVDVLAE